MRVKSLLCWPLSSVCPKVVSVPEAGVCVRERRIGEHTHTYLLVQPWHNFCEWKSYRCNQDSLCP